MALPLSYNWKNLFVRKTTTVLTLLVVCAVVGVFGWMAGFALTLRNSLSFASDDHMLIVLKRGATAESNSAIGPDEANKLAQLSEVAKSPATGELLASPEMLVQVALLRLNDPARSTANVAVRGVTDAAFRVHTNVRLLGPVFSKGANEVIVGQAAARQFGGLQIGDVVNLGYSGNRGYKVVGYFTADGGPIESEIWGYLPSLLNSYQRTMYSSINLRLADNAEPAAVIARIKGPAIELEAQTERAYWQEQSKNIHKYLLIVGILVVIMCLAAGFAIANTMFATVAGRTREFAMLRTIGFSSGQILVSVVIEAVFLALLGGALGCLACEAYLALVGNTKDMFGFTTFTTMAFEIHLSPIIVLLSLALVSVVAALGALFPAFRASRIEVVTALREA